MDHHHPSTEKSVPGEQHQAMTGHDHHAMMIADFRRRFYIVLILTLPILLLSTMIQHWLNIHISFPGSPYVLMSLASAVYVYGGWPFLKGWFDELKARNPG